MLTETTRQGSFPSLTEMTYLNTAAEGIPPLEVGQALEQYFQDHQLGMDGRELHQAQREAPGEGLALSGARNIRIIADEVNNALLIMARAEDYRQVAAALFFVSVAFTRFASRSPSSRVSASCRFGESVASSRTGRAIAATRFGIPRLTARSCFSTVSVTSACRAR